MKIIFCNIAFLVLVTMYCGISLGNYAVLSSLTVDCRVFIKKLNVKKKCLLVTLLSSSNKVADEEKKMEKIRLPLK